MRPEILPGDIFCTRNPMALGRAINAVQKFWSSDNESFYGHAGIICDQDGVTFESLWTIRYAKLDAYLGNQVLIGRHVFMTRAKFDMGMRGVSHHEGQIYPAWRLIFHLFPPAAKYISSGAFPVCSELACKFLCKSGLMPASRWKGKNPDHVADMIRKWRTWRVVYEGIL